MRLLFVVFVVSLCALLWACWAISRHVRRHNAQASGDRAAMRRAAQRFEAAAEYSASASHREDRG